nr:ABC transporter permease [Planococcus glaciei]
MNNRFFTSLAVRNIKSNKQLYVPYLLSSTAIITMFYLMSSLLTNKFVQERSSVLPTLFAMGTIVIGIFSFIFILYINSFLIKRRKKEIGLYGILGLEKKHVAKILFFETLITTFVSIAGALIVGQVFGRLFFMLLNYLLRLPTNINYSTSPMTALITAGLFAGVFAITYLYNVSQFTFANPIKLLKGKRRRERTERIDSSLYPVYRFDRVGLRHFADNCRSAQRDFKVFPCSPAGYYGNLFTVYHGLDLYFEGVEEKQTDLLPPRAFHLHFRHAVPDEAKCGGLSEYLHFGFDGDHCRVDNGHYFVGTEETLENRFPKENNMTLNGTDLSQEELNTQFVGLQGKFREEAQKMELKVTDMESYRYLTVFGNLEGNRLVFEEGFPAANVPLYIQVLLLEDFNEMAGKQIELSNGEALYYHSKGALNQQNIVIGDQEFKLKEADYDFGGEAAIVTTMVLIVPELSQIEMISEIYQQELPQANPASIDAFIGWNTDGTNAQKKALGKQMKQLSSASESLSFESREAFREEWYSMNGGFLFLGIFLGLLFTIGTVLITYFKQVSEGFDDREKFQIMQKVGLDKDMVHESTRSQIVWMFLLPIVTATIHVIFAYPIVRKMLTVFGVTSEITWLLSFTGVVVAFSAIYWMIYRITSRVYYSIVK